MAASRKSRDLFPWKKVRYSGPRWETYGLPPSGVIDEDVWWNLTGIPKELKTVDGAGSLNYTTTGPVTLLNGTAVGDDISSRDGRKLKMISIHLSTINRLTASSAVCIDMSLSLVYDKSPGGALPAYTDIFDTSLAHMANLSNRDRFTVLWTSRFGAGPYSLVAPVLGSDAVCCTECFIDLSNDEANVVYNGTAATIANIAHGAIYLVMRSLSAITANCVYYSRVRFTE